MKDRQVMINWSGAAITLVLLSLLTFALIALVYQSIPDGNRDPFLVIVGMIVSKVGSIVDWHYGGSAATKRQEETIGTLAQTASVAQAALTPNVKPDVVVPAGDSLTVKAADDPDAPKA